MPTECALAALAKYAPLLEVGAGTGYWAHLLQQRGVDILASDLPSWQERFNPEERSQTGARLMGEHRYTHLKVAGPEMALEAAERTLVLMWPDYGGTGIFALEALEMFEGARVVCVGEWLGHTLGAAGTPIPVTGLSFSAEFQRQVDAQFTLEETVALPNWPLHADVVQVFKRK